MILRSYQQAAIERFGDSNHNALFFEMGTGKTITELHLLLDKMKKEKHIFHTLILCPLSTVYNWKREIEKVCPESFIKATQILEGISSKKERLLADKAKRIFIVNLDVVNTRLWQEIIKLPFKALIIDESQKFKSHKAKRTSKLLAFAKGIKYKAILSGNPVPNDERDLWSQMQLLSTNIFPNNFYVFQATYFKDKNASMPKHKHFPDWVLKPGSQETIRKIVATHAARCEASEVLDLPPLICQEVYAELTPEQEKHYKEMKEHFITYIESDAVTAEIALTKLIRLQQITCGILRTEDQETKRISCGKLQALSETLESIGKENKIIIWTNFVDTYNDIEVQCEALGIKSLKLIGGQSAHERNEIINAFKLDDSIRVIIANQAAAGTGTEGLQAARYAIYYNKTFNLADDEQSAARTYRSGSEQHKTCHRIDILTRDTVDEEIHQALKLKKTRSEFILDLKQAFSKGEQWTFQKHEQSLTNANS